MQYKCECGYKTGNVLDLQIHRRTHKEEVIAVDELIEITLNNTVTINGKRYGGTVRVSPALAQDLKYRDVVATNRQRREETCINHAERCIGELR